MKNITFFLFVFFIVGLNAQTSSLGKPYAFNFKFDLPDVGFKLLKLDNKRLIEEENSKVNSSDKIIYYGKPVDVDIDVLKVSNKTILSNGKNIYHYFLESASALSLNVIFSEFKLAQGTILYLFDDERKSYIGAYTSLNNNQSNKLGTDILKSKKIYIEIQEPIENENLSTLKIGRIIHGYKKIDELIDKTLNESGSCHYDVNCPEGKSWKIAKEGVAMIINSTGGFCSGSLINNVEQDGRPYFLTAFHCGSSPETWVYRFKWDAPESSTVCGTGENSVNGPEIYNINGGVTRAKYSVSDFLLIELNSKPNALWNITYNGWDFRDIPASYGAGIHHPSGDIKKISLSHKAYETASYNGGPPNHWIISWDKGVTEGGSSGSPIFNELRRIVGQLHGGGSACGSFDNTDYYGKFSESWIGGGTAETRLSDWLNPFNKPVEFIDANVINKLDPFISSRIIGVDKTSCDGKLKPRVVISNGGSNLLTSVTLEINLNGNKSNLAWTGSLALFQSDTIDLPELVLPNGKHSLEITVLNPNINEKDDELGNNSVKSEFYVIIDTFFVELTLNLDCYGDETTYSIFNSVGEELYREGPFFETTIPITLKRSYCLNEACYKFKINDTYGDGMTSSDCTSGSFYLTNSEQDTLAFLAPENANFQFTLSQDFCMGNATLKEANKELWMIFPNPSSNYFKITKPIQDTIFKIELIDFSGRLIKTWESFKENELFDLNEIASGSYHVFVYLENRHQVFRLEIVK